MPSDAALEHLAPGVDLPAVHDHMVELALTAGAFLRANALARTQFSSSASASALALNVQDKESSVDIVTEADTEAERLILNGIRERWAAHGHKVIAEETYSGGKDKRFLLDDAPTWIVDPLDGTVNFTHLFPLVCVSIGFCVNKVPLVGAVYAPVLSGLSPAAGGTLFSAVRGKGAWQSYPPPNASGSGLDHSAVRLSALSSPPPSLSVPPLRLPLAPPKPLPREAPKGCLFASEWGKDRRDGPESNLPRKVASFWNMAAELGGRGGRGGHVNGVRSLGSAALDMVLCATAAVDIFWEGGCWEWDVCGAMAILHEAGGVVFDANPSPSASLPTTPLQEASLGGRRYLAIRACAPTVDEGGREVETPRQAQERVAREVYKRVEALTYVRECVTYPP